MCVGVCCFLLTVGRVSRGRKGTPTTSLKSTYLQSNLEAPPLPYHRCSLLESRPTWKRLWTCLELARQYNSMCTCASQMYQACIQGRLRKVLLPHSPRPKPAKPMLGSEIARPCFKRKTPRKWRKTRSTALWLVLGAGDESVLETSRIWHLVCVCVC